MLNESTAIIPMKEYLELLKIKEQSTESISKNEHLKVVMGLGRLKRSDIAIKALASILTVLKHNKPMFHAIVEVLEKEKIGILVSGDAFIHLDKRILPEHIKLKAL